MRHRHGSIVHEPVQKRSSPPPPTSRVIPSSSSYSRGGLPPPPPPSPSSPLSPPPPSTLPFSTPPPPPPRPSPRLSRPAAGSSPPPSPLNGGDERPRPISAQPCKPNWEKSHPTRRSRTVNERHASCAVVSCPSPLVGAPHTVPDVTTSCRSAAARAVFAVGNHTLT